MRRIIGTILLGVFLSSAIAGGLIGYFSVDLITKTLIERELEVTHEAIRKKFSQFDALLEREEAAMEARMAASLPVVAERLLKRPPESYQVGDEAIRALSDELGVSNTYVVDKNTVVVATDFAPDKGFELGKISEGFRQFLTGMIGSGKFISDRINMSSKTGILTKYGYFSPKGSEYIAEVSINVRDYLRKERSGQFVNFLFNSFFKDIIDTQEHLTGLDIHMVNKVGFFSLFDRNANLPTEIAEALFDKDRVATNKGDAWTVYSRLSPVNSRLSTADYLAITTTFNFSELAMDVRLSVGAILGAMIAIAAFFYLLAVRMASRHVVRRVESIREGVSRIAQGDYEHDLKVEGHDEISDIASDINLMRGRIAADITNRNLQAKKLSDAIAAANESRKEAEEANKAKSQFLSSMSHELRTPMNAIIGFSQLLETDEENPLSEEQKESVKHISGSGSHLLNLINEVLDLAKIESGKLDLSIEDVPPADAIQASLNMTKGLAKKQNIEVINERLNCEACSNPCLIRVDEGRFVQVLVNLLSNGIKYNSKGGTVTVTCERNNKGYMRFNVTDTGLGIPEHMKEEVFSPFHRIHAGGGSIEGTGIGLTITKNIVELMGGRIGFTSVENIGSTFWVEFPLADPAKTD